MYNNRNYLETANAILELSQGKRHKAENTQWCFFILIKLPYFFFFEDETAMNIMINTTTTPPTAAQVITIPFNLKIRLIKT